MQVQFGDLPVEAARAAFAAAPFAVDLALVGVFRALGERQVDQSGQLVGSRCHDRPTQVAPGDTGALPSSGADDDRLCQRRVPAGAATRYLGLSMASTVVAAADECADESNGSELGQETRFFMRHTMNTAYPEAAAIAGLGLRQRRTTRFSECVAGVDLRP